MPNQIGPGPAIVFTPLLRSAAAVSVVGTQFSPFIMQPGVYRVDWAFSYDVAQWNGNPYVHIQPTLNGQPVIQLNDLGFSNLKDTASGLMQVTTPNSVFQFIGSQLQTSAANIGGCFLTFTQLQ